MSEDTPQVNQESRARFDADGVVLLRGLLPPMSVAALGQAIDSLSAKRPAGEPAWMYPAEDAYALELAEAERAYRVGERGPASKETSPERDRREPPAGSAMHSWSSVWRRNIVVRVIALDSALPQIAAEILGATKVNFCGDRVLVQEPKSAGVTLFTREEALLPVTGGRGCAIWICLDGLSEADCLAFAPGSQRWPEKPVLKATTSGRIEGETPVRFACQPGDLLVQDLRTYYALGANSAPQKKRMLALEYCAEDMRYRRRANAPTRSASPNLKDGAALDSLDFPVVWPRPHPGFAIATLYENASPATDPSRRGRI